MKLFTLSCLIAFTYFSASAQNINAELDKLIAEGMLSAAEYKVDSMLMLNPGNIDALMYKGNLQYYKSSSYTDIMSLKGNPNESVYSSEYAYIGQYLEIVPKKVADTIAFYFVNALKLDPSRDDIRLGLNYIYSVSLQGDKLIEQLPLLAKISSITSLNIRDYAYNMIDRGAVEEGMKVYAAISNVFPEDGNLMSDLAVEYYINGDIIKSMSTALNSLKTGNLDSISYSNTFFIFGVMEEYDLALLCIENWSKIKKNKTNSFYSALVKMYRKDAGAKQALADFVAAETIETNEKKLAKYLLSVDLNIPPNKFDTVLTFGLTDAFNILISHHFYNVYPNEFSPAYTYAENLTYNKRYQEAIAIYPKVILTGATVEEINEYDFYYAWALYKAGKTEQANLLWKTASTSSIPFLISGSNYFLGKYYYDEGDMDTARKYFLLGAYASGNSK
jgi:hypothetical protein